ncbi:MAG: molybdenum cofactor biosynthesis protein MoaE [Firmicutes bacterium]|nr:molybdenum cofactor biosynthesis protein MoaE [Bacillota bacterium]
MRQKKPPSIEAWLKEAKADATALKAGMFLVHNGIVRQTPKAKVRQGLDDGSLVAGMDFSFNAAKVEAAVAKTYQMKGICCVKVWLNEGRLKTGDDIMYVLVGGDIRPHVTTALQFLVEEIKSRCVTETELKVPGKR